jgi:hypothetical protein
MAGLVPAIHVFLVSIAGKTCMPGTRPGMTAKAARPISNRRLSYSNFKQPGFKSSLRAPAKQSISPHKESVDCFVAEPVIGRRFCADPLAPRNDVWI